MQPLKSSAERCIINALYYSVSRYVRETYLTRKKDHRENDHVV